MILLKSVQNRLRAVSLTEGIRRSLKLAEKIMEFQRGDAQVILRTPTTEQVLIIV